MAKDNELEFIVGHIYRAKKPSRTRYDEFNDREILRIGPLTVQYDSSSVHRGKKYPSIPKEEFEAWAGQDVTEEYKSVPEGRWAEWKRR